jgi:adenosylcobinamide kinase / adenosylcobinamide-phosphate guanylyltransferase
VVLPQRQTTPLTLITGGIRSGKSELAERLASELGRRIAYLATGAAIDAEMRARIAAHQHRRPSSWITVEAGGGRIAELMEPHSEHVQGILLDDLGGLASYAVLHTESIVAAEAWMEREEESIFSLLRTRALPAVAVTSEVGLSLVPTNELGRRFTDVLGRANQRWAGVATSVTFVVAGLPWKLK